MCARISLRAKRDYSAGQGGLWALNTEKLGRPLWALADPSRLQINWLYRDRGSPGSARPRQRSLRSFSRRRSALASLDRPYGPEEKGAAIGQLRAEDRSWREQQKRR